MLNAAALIDIIESRYRAGDMELVQVTLKALERESREDAETIRQMIALAHH